MRVRSTDQTQPTAVTYTETMVYPPYSGSGSYASNTSVGSHKEVKDYVHPGYARRRRQGEIILGDFDLNTGERSFSSGSTTYVQNNGRYSNHCVGDIAGFSPHSGYCDTSLASDLGRMSEVALVKAMANIREEQVMSGEILSDLSSTISMLRHPFRSSVDLLSRIHKSARKSYGKTARSIAQANAGAWLEYRYGWRPLISDTRQIMKNAGSFRSRLFKRRLVSRGSQVQSRTSTKTFDHEQLTGALSCWSASGSVVTDNQVSAHAGVVYEVVNRTSAQQLSDDFRLGADSIPQTLWELTPYSFVVDWFVNVGDWLEAVTPNPGINVLGNWVTTTDRNIAFLSGTLHCRKGSEFVESGSLGSSTLTQVGVHRRCNVRLPSSPTRNYNFDSVSQAVDSVSLSLKPLFKLLDKVRH